MSEELHPLIAGIFLGDLQSSSNGANPPASDKTERGNGIKERALDAAKAERQQKIDRTKKVLVERMSDILGVEVAVDDVTDSYRVTVDGLEFYASENHLYVTIGRNNFMISSLAELGYAIERSQS